MNPAIVHVTATHAADDTRITVRELGTLLDAVDEAWIVARPPRGPLDPRLNFVEGPAYQRASRPELDWPALDAAVRSTPSPRIVHVHEPATAIAAKRFDWCDREHLIYDIHEYHAAMTAHRARGLRRLGLKWIAERQHRAACRASATAIAVNEELAADARRRGVPRVEVLTNAALLGHGPAIPAARPDAALVYVGGVSAPRGTGTMLDAFARIRAARPDATLEIVGPLLDADAHTRLDTPPEGVTVRGTVPPEDARAAMRRASIGLVPFERVVHYRGRPAKLLEYAAEGLSVVATAGGPKEDWIRSHRAGAVVPPADSGAIADACLARIDNPARARDEGDRARAAAAEISWERVEGPKLLALYRHLLGEEA